MHQPGELIAVATDGRLRGPVSVDESLNASRKWNRNPLRSARYRMRSAGTAQGFGGVDHGGVERAVDHQRLCDGERRRAMLLDQCLRFLCTKSEIGINRDFRTTDQADCQDWLDDQISAPS
jgi:hypothetical protein